MFNKLRDFYKSKSKKINTILISIIILSLLSGGLYIFKLNKDLVKENINLKFSLHEADSIKNVYGNTIAIQQVETTNDKDYIKQLTDSIFSLKKKNDRQIKSVIAYYQSRVNVRVDSFETAWVDTLQMKKFSDSVEKGCSEVLKYFRDSSAQVGTTFLDSTKDYTFSATITSPLKLRVNSFQLIDTQDIRISKLKGSFLKKDQQGKRKLFLKQSYRIEVKHSNTYFKDVGMKSIIFVPKKDNKFLKGFGLGIITALVGITVL